MKTVITTLGTAGILTMAAHADMTFAAPGMDSTQGFSGTSLNEAISLGNYWSYEVTGYEWRLVAGEPISNDPDNAAFIEPETGKLVYKNDHAQYKGSSSASASVNGVAIFEDAALSALNIQDQATGSDSFSSPVEFSDKDMTVSFSQVSNMVNDYGSYIVLRGACIKEAPVPTGSLSAPELVELGSFPTIEYDIKREGITGTSPDFSPQAWSPTVTPGDTSSTPPTSETEGSGSSSTGGSVEAPNYGKDKTNKGHGNNEDGIDSDNPGKSAEKWNAHGIISEAEYLANEAEVEDADELIGGGAAPSLD